MSALRRLWRRLRHPLGRRPRYQGRHREAWVLGPEWQDIGWVDEAAAFAEPYRAAIDADVRRLADVTDTPYGLFQAAPTSAEAWLEHERCRSFITPGVRQRWVNELVEAAAVAQFGGFRRRWVAGMSQSIFDGMDQTMRELAAEWRAAELAEKWEAEHGYVIFDDYLGMLEVQPDKRPAPISEET